MEQFRRPASVKPNLRLSGTTKTKKWASSIERDLVGKAYTLADIPIPADLPACVTLRTGSCSRARSPSLFDLNRVALVLSDEGDPAC